MPSNSTTTNLAGDGPSSQSGTAPASPVRPATTPPPSVATTPQPTKSASASPTRPEIDGAAGVALGLDALERQMQEQERTRVGQHQTTTLQTTLTAQPRPEVQNRSYRDDDTDPASSLTGDSSQNTPEDQPYPSSFERFIQKTRKRLSSRDNGVDPTRGVHMIHHVDRDISEAEMWEAAGRPLICGYLHKFSRNGKWQRRFFESDGESLSYYKSEARSKMLASLDLCKVGTIGIDPSDSTACMFSIQVADRPYSLRAETKASAMDWVITLNRIKEARMQVGHVKLVPTKEAHLSPGQSNEFTPRVVLVANRQRTRAVDSDNVNSIEDLLRASNEEKQSLSHGPDASSEASKRIQRAVAARWQKRRSSLSRLGVRLVRWAKSVKFMHVTHGCTDAEDQVVLDHHVHPPGHDDPHKAGKGSVIASSGSGDGPQGPSAWIGKEAQMTGATTIPPGVSSSSAEDDEEVETRQIA